MAWDYRRFDSVSGTGDHMTEGTSVVVSTLELEAINRRLDQGENLEAKDIVQQLAAAYGLPPLASGRYGLDLDTGEILAP